jgi:hypothetical protein
MLIDHPPQKETGREIEGLPVEGLVLEKKLLIGFH